LVQEDDSQDQIDPENQTPTEIKLQERLSECQRYIDYISNENQRLCDELEKQVKLAHQMKTVIFFFFLLFILFTLFLFHLLLIILF